MMTVEKILSNAEKNIVIAKTVLELERNDVVKIEESPKEFNEMTWNKIMDNPNFTPRYKLLMCLFFESEYLGGYQIVGFRYQRLAECFGFTEHYTRITMRRLEKEGFFTIQKVEGFRGNFIAVFNQPKEK